MLGTEEQDSAWEDPLPHALSPTRYYLSRMKKGHTRAVIILMHGRGDNVEDFSGVFLPILSMRYGGKDRQLNDDDDEEEKEKNTSCRVAVIGIEARDNSWYPDSHLSQDSTLNAPYQYSSLHKIRETILSACKSTGLEPQQVILVGFSQGANLANTYLLSGLLQLEKEKCSIIPLPGHIIALAGSLFKVMPSFPARQYTSRQHQEEVSKEEGKVNEQSMALSIPSKIINRLICGTNDRFFTQDEIQEAASTLAKQSAEVKDMIDVQISIVMEPRAPHTVTNRMMAAVIEAIDNVLVPDTIDE